MRVLLCLCLVAGTLLSGNPQSLFENKFGIVPLHSTRADVQRLYGVPSDSCVQLCNFRTLKETINVAFATAPCAGPEYGWNVPRDTVLSFTVRSMEPSRFSEISSALNGFVERRSAYEPGTTYYTNVEKGIVFSVQDRHVVRVTYFPPSAENGKRCEGFSPYDGVPPPNPYLTILDLDKDGLSARLDNFAVSLGTSPRTRGYIVAYAGKKSRRGEAKGMAEEARQYLIETRMISPECIIGIDGGFREKAQYDLFILSQEMPPPTPTPTVPSNEVQIVGSRTRDKRGSPKMRYK